MSHEKLRVAMHEGDEVDIRKHLHALWHRRVLFLAVAIVVAVLMVLVRQTYVPMYHSSGLLVVEPETIPGITRNGGVGVLSWTSAEFQPTQIALMQSRKVMEGAFERLKLADDPAFSGMPHDQQVELFRKSFNIAPTLEFSHLVTIEAQGDDYQRLPLWANALMEEYISQYKEHRRNSSDNTYVWLSEQLQIMKTKVEASERALLQYKTKEDVVSLEKRQALLEQDLTDLSKSYQKAQSERMQKEALLEAFKSLKSLTGKLDFFQKAESFDAQKNNQYIQNLRSEYNRLDAELLDLEKKYKPQHPKIISLKSQLARITTRLKDEVSKVHQKLRVELQIAKSHEKAARNQLDVVKKQSMSLAKQAIDYNVLRRESDTNRKLYENLLEKMKQANVTGSIDADNIRIAQRAVIDSTPINKPLHWLIVIAVILFIPSLIVVIAELLDHSIKTEDDISFYLELPVLGQIKKMKEGIDVSGHIPGVITRAYRDIRTAIGFYTKDHMMKTLVVTSATVAEGKTTDSILLAKAFANSGQRVLLVDADVFKSSIAKTLHLEVSKGLTDMVLNAEQYTDDHAIRSLIVDSSIDGVDLLPSGLIPPNPSEVVRSDEIGRVLARLKHEYDIVIVDTPPLRAGLEVAVLASRADAVLLSLRSNHISRVEAIKVVERLRSSKCNIMGTILTFSKQDYGGNKGYYGYYGYYDESYDRSTNSDKDVTKA